MQFYVWFIFIIIFAIDAIKTKIMYLFKRTYYFLVYTYGLYGQLCSPCVKLFLRNPSRSHLTLYVKKQRYTHPTVSIWASPFSFELD